PQLGSSPEVTVRCPWKVNDAQLCCAFQAITGAKTIGATAPLAQTGQRSSIGRRVRLVSRNSASPGARKASVYLLQRPSPANTPAASHQPARPSRDHSARAQSVAAQNSADGGSGVIRKPSPMAGVTA